MHVASLSTINHKVRIYGVVDYSVIILLQIFVEFAGEQKFKNL